jgi:DNA-binding NarL/FixJ family response regulator
MESAIRVYIVDDHELVRIGLCSVFDGLKDIEVKGSFGLAKECLEALSQEQPDVVILDIKLPDGDGADLARQIKKKYPQTKVIMLTGFHSSSGIVSSLESGVDGYLFKESPTEDLLRAVREVMAGRTFMTPQVTTELKKVFIGAKPSFTPKELEVVKALNKGLTTAEMAKELCIAESTLKTHLSHIYQKLGVDNRLQALRELRKLGFFEGEEF